MIGGYAPYFFQLWCLGFPLWPTSDYSVNFKFLLSQGCYWNIALQTWEISWNIYLSPVDQPAESAAGSSSWYVAGRMNWFSSGSKAWAALCHLRKCRSKYGEFNMLWESKSREIIWYSSPAWNVWVFGEVLPNSHHSSDVAMWGCNQSLSMPGMTKTY